MSFSEKRVTLRNSERSSLTRIRGLVMPTDWDEDGKITGISISAFDEQEYPVCLDTKGKKLISLVRREVEVDGLFIEKGEQRFKVLSHNLLNGEK